MEIEEDAGRPESPSEWDRLDECSKRFAIGSTELSERLERVEERFRSLAGKLPAEVRLANHDRAVFRRFSGEWGLGIVTAYIMEDTGEPHYSPKPLHDLSVRDKARLAEALPDLLQRLLADTAEINEDVQAGLSALDVVDGLLGSHSREGE